MVGCFCFFLMFLDENHLAHLITMNTSDTGNADKVELILMQTAYKFYTIKAMSCDINSPQDFMLSTHAKAIWEDPLFTIHKALQNMSIDCYTSYTITITSYNS